MSVPAPGSTLKRLRDALATKGVVYLIIGKGGALLHGLPDTTQNVDIFVQDDVHNNIALVEALSEFGSALSDDQTSDIVAGKAFIQLAHGPLPVDLVYAPDGIGRFEDAWQRGEDIDGYPVCSLDDIIASKRAANREKDRNSMRHLEAFRNHLRARGAPRRHLPALRSAQAQRLCHRDPLPNGRGNQTRGRLSRVV